MIHDLDALYEHAASAGAAYAAHAGLILGDPALYASWYCWHHQTDQPPHEQAVPEYRTEMIAQWSEWLATAEARGERAPIMEHRERLRRLGAADTSMEALDVTDSQLNALRDEASSAGDLDLVAVVDLALQLDNREARAECARVIAQRQARRVPDSHTT